MNNRIKLLHGKQGSAILVTMVLTFSVALMIAGVIRLVMNELAFTDHSAKWSQCVHTAESGVELAIAALQQEIDTDYDWIANGWTKQGTVFTKAVDALDPTGHDFPASQYTVTVDKSDQFAPSITSTGTMPDTIAGGLISRTVRVALEPILDSAFNYGLLTKGSLTFGGGNILDSFDSSDPSKSTNGQYDPAKRLAGFDLKTEGDSAGIIQMNGGVEIYGDVATAAGGDVNMTGVGNAISGTVTDDFDDDIPDATIPAEFAAMTVGFGWNGTTDINVSGTQYMKIDQIDLTGGQTVTIQGSGTLKVWVDQLIDLTGQSQIILSPAAGSDLKIEIYINGDADFSGKGIVNESGNAADLTMIGTENCNDIRYTGSSSFIGGIFAPAADLTIGGAGDFIGAAVGKAVNFGGTGSMHYDENLKKDGFPIIVSWRQVMWDEL